MQLQRRRVVACAVPAAIMAISHALAVVLDSDEEGDGRSRRRPPSIRWSMRRSLFTVADNDPAFDEGWFRDTFRCSKSSFDYIWALIEKHWDSCHEPIKENSCFYIRDRTAVALYRPPSIPPIRLRGLK